MQQAKTCCETDDGETNVDWAKPVFESKTALLNRIVNRWITDKWLANQREEA